MLVIYARTKCEPLSKSSFCAILNPKKTNDARFKRLLLSLIVKVTDTFHKIVSKIVQE